MRSYSIYLKGFLKKYKIFFLKGYFEDIFFHLKILFFNKDRKIYILRKKFTLKNIILALLQHYLQKNI